jgi:hypothetical protein
VIGCGFVSSRRYFVSIELIRLQLFIDALRQAHVTEPTFVEIGCFFIGRHLKSEIYTDLMQLIDS